MEITIEVQNEINYLEKKVLVSMETVAILDLFLIFFNVLFSRIPCDMVFQINHSDSRYMYVHHVRRKFE